MSFLSNITLKPRWSNIQTPSAALCHTDLHPILDLRSCLDVGRQSSSIPFHWGGYGFCPYFLVLGVSLFGTGGSFGAGTQEGIFGSLDLCRWKLVLAVLLKVFFFFLVLKNNPRALQMPGNIHHYVMALAFFNLKFEIESHWVAQAGLTFLILLLQLPAPLGS